MLTEPVQGGRTQSTSEKCGLLAAIGGKPSCPAAAWIASMRPTVQFETPQPRIFPARCAAPSVCTMGSTGAPGKSRWRR
jgi:hypothetical protein